MKLAYKIFCLPLTNAKRVKLVEWIEEYADIYNFAAQFIPSLPEKYFKFKQPSPRSWGAGVEEALDF